MATQPACHDLELAQRAELLPVVDVAAEVGPEHGLMMPAMLVPMFFRLDLYTRKHGQHLRQPPISSLGNPRGRRVPSCRRSLLAATRRWWSPSTRARS
jgi:hypothetical protein